MNEEEMKAIEYFEKSFEKRVPPYWYDDTIANNEEQIKILLNLIDKQQKEIEELKKPKYIMDLKTNSITILINDCISKDTIREKISDLEEDLNENNYGEKTTISIKYAIKVLQELLEEGENK